MGADGGLVGLLQINLREEGVSDTCGFTDRRQCDGRRWEDANRSCVMVAYAVFSFYGFALGSLVGYIVCKLWG